MASKKRIFIKKSRRVKRNKAERNKKPIKPIKLIVKDDKQEYINKWDKEQQEWARTFNHKENEE
tara:strand:- start:438 stop:629 length:192 start_codon:yes stop_codon:yes gene_type:complete